MARPSRKLIDALRKTIIMLRNSQRYAWGHMGHCNCGFLAQTITELSPKEIHQMALSSRGNDWAERAIDYCPDSGYPIDHIIAQMLELGLSQEDIVSLEKLNDGRVLERLPEGQKYLRRNHKEDVLLYFETWADLLEEKLQSKLPELGQELNNVVALHQNEDPIRPVGKAAVS